MRLVLLQLVALLLTLVAWGSDVIHIMHLGADESLAEHHALTGDEEPDSARNEGVDEEAVTLDVLDLLPLTMAKAAHMEARHELAGDDHSRVLLRPPRPLHA